MFFVSNQVNQTVYLLFEPSGSDFEAEDEEVEYDELDYREEGQFWSTHDDGVDCAEDGVYEEDYKEETHAKPEPVVSLFALGTLSRYSFFLCFHCFMRGFML